MLLRCWIPSVYFACIAGDERVNPFPALMTSYDVNGTAFPICWNDDVWCPVGILAVHACSLELEAQVEKNDHFWLL